MTEANDFVFDSREIKKYIRTHRGKVKHFIKVLIPYLLIYGAFLVVIGYFNINPDSVKEFFAGKGLLLIPIFIALQMLAALTPLPDLPFIAIGVLFFQPWFAFLLIWLGMWMASIINFYIARRLGRKFVVSRYPQTAEWIDRFTGKYGFETIILARNFTFVTFDLVAYAAGISNISVSKFGFASVFGILPIALNSTLVGTALTAGDLIKTAFFVSISAALSIIMGLLARQWRLYSERRQTLTSA